MVGWWTAEPPTSTSGLQPCSSARVRLRSRARSRQLSPLVRTHQAVPPSRAAWRTFAAYHAHLIAARPLRLLCVIFADGMMSWVPHLPKWSRELHRARGRQPYQTQLVLLHMPNHWDSLRRHTAMCDSEGDLRSPRRLHPLGRCKDGRRCGARWAWVRGCGVHAGG